MKSSICLCLEKTNVKQSIELNFDYYFKILSWKFSYYLLSIGLTLITSYLIVEKLYTIVLFPFVSRGYDSDFIFTRLHEGFETSLFVCILFSLYWTFPYVLYLWWSFVVPSLYVFERKQISFLCILFCFLQFLLWPCSLWLLEQSILFFTSFEFHRVDLESTGLLQDSIFQIHYTPHISFLIQFVFSLCFTFQIAVFFLVWCITEKSVRSFLLKIPRSVAWSFLFLIVAFCVPPDIFFQIFLSFCCCVIFEILLFISVCEKEYQMKTDVL